MPDNKERIEGAGLLRVCLDQALPQVAVTVAGRVDDQHKDPVHLRIEIVEDSFRELYLGAEIVSDKQAAVTDVFACPKAVRKSETIDSIEGDDSERCLCKLAVLKISKKRNLLYYNSAVS